MKLLAIGLPGESGPWVALGFEPDDHGRLGLANGSLEFGHDGARFVVAPSLDDDGAPDVVDGLTVSLGTVSLGPVSRSPVSRSTVLGARPQPNGALALDHVVVMTDSIERTSSALHTGLGLEQRRVRETATVRQAFHRFADEGATKGCIVELVESDRVRQPSIWGVVVIVADLDATVAAAPQLIGRPKPAVQPGRQIATVDRTAGLPVAVAFMDADQPRSAARSSR